MFLVNHQIQIFRLFRHLKKLKNGENQKNGWLGWAGLGWAGLGLVGSGRGVWLGSVRFCFVGSRLVLRVCFLDNRNPACAGQTQK